MDIRFRCNSCGHSFGVDQNSAGKVTMHCPNCGGTSTVPKAATGTDITFYCDQCGQSIAIDAVCAGLRAECPKCGQPLTVPSHETPATKAPTPKNYSLLVPQDVHITSIRLTWDDVFRLTWQFVVCSAAVGFVFGLIFYGWYAIFR
jgi:hypothetical protein